MKGRHTGRDMDFSKYDDMTTEELAQLLQSDTDAVDEELNADELLYISELLARRDGIRKIEQREAFRPARKTEKKVVPGWRKRALVRSAPAVLALLVLFSGTVATMSESYKSSSEVVRQDGQFYLGRTDGASEQAILAEGQPQNALQELLASYGFPVALAPGSLPEGYQIAYVEYYEDDLVTLDVTLENTETGTDFSFDVMRLTSPNASTLIMGDVVELYESNGVVYSLYRNNQRMGAAWIVGDYWCKLSGHLELEEVKELLDTIQIGG